MKVNENWRKLSDEQLVEGLVACGILRKAAEEYLDDKNAIPKQLRKALNSWIDYNNIGVK